MKRLILIQIFVLLVAVVSGIGCAVLGTLESTAGFDSYIADGRRVPVSGNLDTGLDGGAIGLGVISGLCFIAFVWIEITKFNSKK